MRTANTHRNESGLSYATEDNQKFTAAGRCADLFMNHIYTHNGRDPDCWNIRRQMGDKACIKFSLALRYGSAWQAVFTEYSQGT